MGNKIALDIHEIMQQLGIEQASYKQAFSGYSESPEGKEEVESLEAEACVTELDETRSTPCAEGWRASPAKLIVVI